MRWFVALALLLSTEAFANEWHVVKDPLNPLEATGAYLQANEANSYAQPGIAIRCTSPNSYQVFVYFDRFLGRPTAYVRWKFEFEQEWSARWYTTSDGKAVIVPPADAAGFLNNLGAEDLAIEAADTTGRAYVLHVANGMATDFLVVTADLPCLQGRW